MLTPRQVPPAVAGRRPALPGVGEGFERDVGRLVRAVYCPGHPGSAVCRDPAPAGRVLRLSLEARFAGEEGDSAGHHLAPALRREFDCGPVCEVCTGALKDVVTLLKFEEFTDALETLLADGCKTATRGHTDWFELCKAAIDALLPQWENGLVVLLDGNEEALCANPNRQPAATP